MQNLKIGNYNELEVSRESPHGMYLHSSEGEILMPKRFVTPSLKPQDVIKVFVYTDSEDRLVATTQEPKAVVGEFASLVVKDVTTVGAFLDWGLDKDLLLPYREQLNPVTTGDHVVVYLVSDPKTQRVVAISKIQAFISSHQVDLRVGQEVELMIYDQTPMGYKALVDRKYNGLLYRNETFEKISLGLVTQGFVKKVREDDKIDLSLQQQGIKGMKDARSTVLDALKNNDGQLPLHDKSSPEDIYKLLGMSKKNYKKALGNLYRQKMIEKAEDGIKLIP